jgi:hypothetical protein
MMSSMTWRMYCLIVLPHHAHAPHGAELLCHLVQWSLCCTALSGHWAL